MPKRKTAVPGGDAGSSIINKEEKTVKNKVIQSKYFSMKAENSHKLTKKFFDQTGEDLAKSLLGKKLVRMHEGERMSGIIVETEAYLGLVDKAAHSYNGKRSNKTEAMFMEPGTAYVYYIYGVYCCMNISCQGEGCAVLLRAVEPLEGKEKMNLLRWKNTNNETNVSTDKDKPPVAKVPKKLTKKEKDLSNGPSKMCQALDITKPELNKVDLTDSDKLWLEDGDPISDSKIVVSKRINIGYAEDWVDKLLRFYILNNDFVSVRDKPAEKILVDIK
ncbi:putative 3-methyladenine DNA glycosylase isoform X2 [Patella vulgata]|nr:putative 3-methyladenine DNA glycosylase isoform X2 [Patella vulgata]